MASSRERRVAVKSKQQTPLGYLMSLLGVSLADLGDYLYVAQSSISKWKTGARALHADSSHFAGIVEYFTMLARDERSHAKMVTLFEKLYPEQPLEKPEDFTLCLRAFLGGKLLPSASLQQSLSEEGRLYTAQVGVYGGERGCASAYGQLVGYLQDRPPGAVSMLNRLSLDRLAGLLPALEAGHAVRALIAYPQPAELLGAVSATFTHPGAQVRLAPEGIPFPKGALLVAVDSDLMLLGNSPPGRAPYCALATDALSIEQMQGLFEGAWQEGEDAFTAVPPDHLGPEAYEQAAQTTVEALTDWLAPTLPYVTMSRPLLMEVLRSNDVSGRVWTRILAGHKALESTRLRLFIPAEGLRGRAAPLPELSMLCGQEITTTAIQARRHQLDTAALLRAGDRITILPVQGQLPEVWRRVSAYVKHNAYAGYLDLAAQTVRLTRNPRLVEAMMAAIAGIVEQSTQETAQPGYVAGLLERAALS